MPQETKQKFEVETPAERATLQGLVASRDDEQALLTALEQAFDYRGDVTLELVGGERVVGYIFDRRVGATLASSSVRLLCEGSDEKVTVTFDRIARLEISGRDTAAGKSFDTWLKKYVEKKLAGERASIESEPLV